MPFCWGRIYERLLETHGDAARRFVFGRSPFAGAEAVYDGGVTLFCGGRLVGDFY